MELLKRILFVILVLGIICGEILRIDTGQSIAFTLLDCGVGLFVLVSLSLQFFQKKVISIKIEKYILLFIGTGIFSLFLNRQNLTLYEALVSLLYALRFIFYTFGISIGIQLLGKKWQNYIVYLLFSSAVALAVLGFIQYFFYPALWNLYYAGWDNHYYRIFSAFLARIFMGLFYVFGIMLGIYLSLQSMHGQKRLVQGIFIFSTVLISIALILTYSRSAYLAVVIGVSILVWRLGEKKLFTIGFGSMLLVIFLVGIFGHHLEGTNVLRIATVNSRLGTFHEVSAVIARHPIFGVGFDAYRYAQLPDVILHDRNWVMSHARASTDNSFLFVWATTGILGLGLYVFLTYKILFFAYTQKGVVSGVLLASYVAAIVGSFFINALFYPFILVWLWILVGLMESM